MASKHQRKRPDGTYSDHWQVRWREGGRTVTTTAPDEKSAKRIVAIVEATGTYTDEMGRTDVPTLREWAAHHLEHSTRANADTIEGYRRVLARHVFPRLGDLALTAITADAVRSWIKTLAMSDKSRRQVVSLLSSVMFTAVQAGHIPANPVQGIRLGRKDPPRRRHLITPVDLGVILLEIPELYLPLVSTLAGTGMRWGEAAALTVEDVDLHSDPPVIHVTKAVKHRARQGAAPGLPKTEKGLRDVALAPLLVPVLAALLDRPRSAPLFVNRLGKPVRHSTFHGAVWSKALDRAQDPERHGNYALTYRPRIHDLRAFATTWLIDQGVPMDAVADQLGHESIDTTHRIYRRVNPESGRKAAAAMSAILAQAVRPQIEG